MPSTTQIDEQTSQRGGFETALLRQPGSTAPAGCARTLSLSLLAERADKPSARAAAGGVLKSAAAPRETLVRKRGSQRRASRRPARASLQVFGSEPKTEAKARAQRLQNRRMLQNPSADAFGSGLWDPDTRETSCCQAAEFRAFAKKTRKTGCRVAQASVKRRILSDFCVLRFCSVSSPSVCFRQSQVVIRQLPSVFVSLRVTLGRIDVMLNPYAVILLKLLVIVTC